MTPSRFGREVYPFASTCPIKMILTQTMKPRRKTVPMIDSLMMTVTMLRKARLQMNMDPWIF